MSEESETPVTMADYHADQIGRAVLGALHGLDAEVWFDVGCALVTDERVREAIGSAIGVSSTERDAMQEDVAELLRALGLGDHARPVSCHRVIQDEVLPEIRRRAHPDGEVREALEEALDRLEEAAQYKGGYLAEKHGDLRFVNETRARLLGEEGGG